VPDLGKEDLNRRKRLHLQSSEKAAESLTAESFFEEPWKNPPSEKHLFNDSAANDSAKNLPPTPPVQILRSLPEESEDFSHLASP
jgi:hypothetical protein